jgi:hypothetical protein
MNITYLEIFKNSITVIVAVLGWLVGHYFTNKRDRASKRRDVSLQHLINAYRVLTDDISHRPETIERTNKLESIITDIQLFGSKKQIELVKQLVVEVAAGGEFQLDPLINDLRNDLRKEIGLQEIEGNVKWLRIT